MQASPTSPPVPCVSMRQPIPSSDFPCDLIQCRRPTDARVFEVDPNTVLGWLVEAAEQLEAFSRYFLCDVHIGQLQLDELYAVLGAVKDGEISEAEVIERLERSPQ